MLGQALRVRVLPKRSPRAFVSRRPPSAVALDKLHHDRARGQFRFVRYSALEHPQKLARDHLRLNAVGTNVQFSAPDIDRAAQFLHILRIKKVEHAFTPQRNHITDKILGVFFVFARGGSPRIARRQRHPPKSCDEAEAFNETLSEQLQSPHRFCSKTAG